MLEVFSFQSSVLVSLHSSVLTTFLSMASRNGTVGNGGKSETEYFRAAFS
jgi:hypothetical protein